MRPDNPTDDVALSQCIQRHEVLQSLINTARRPLYELVTNSIRIADLEEWLVDTEEHFFGEDGEWREWSDCRLCKGTCDFSVQTVIGVNSRMNDSFRDWRNEIPSLFQLDREWTADDWDYARNDGESPADWLRRSFTQIPVADEDHSAPVLFRVKRPHRHYSTDLLTGTFDEAFVWYTASGFRERILTVNACLPTREIADSWRADNLGLVSPDEVTEERISAHIDVSIT